MRRTTIRRGHIAFIALVVAVVVVAQIAGVTGRSAQGIRLSDDGEASSSFMIRGVTGAELQAALGEDNRKVKRIDPAGGGWHEVLFQEPTSPGAAQQLLAGAGATDIEMVWPRTLMSATTQDAGAAKYGDAQWQLAPAAGAARSTGALDATGMVVAVLDTGVDASHPDLLEVVSAEQDFSGSAGGARADVVGHGTAVASIIAATGEGMQGVAPGASVMSLKVFRDSENAFTMAGYLSAIRHAADEGADVILIPFACVDSRERCHSSAERDAIEYATKKGVLVVSPAGNGDGKGAGRELDGKRLASYPAGYQIDGSIGVSAVDDTWKRSAWSDRGFAIDHHGPGEQIIVAVPGEEWRVEAGTSLAAAHVAGYALVAKKETPDLTPSKLAELLQGAGGLPGAAT